MNKLEQIHELLPEGLSKSGIKEVTALIESIIQERAAEQTKLLETKVSGFLRTKIDVLKETAKQELESDHSDMRSLRVYAGIKALVAGDLTGSDVETVVNEHEQMEEVLRNKVEELSSQLTRTLDENQMLVGQVNSLNQENDTQLNQMAELEEKRKLPFKSSESAVVITNESHDTGVEKSLNYTNNEFLNEDIIQLSKSLHNQRG